jgi:hypothetical protein
VVILVMTGCSHKRSSQGEPINVRPSVVTGSVAWRRVLADFAADGRLNHTYRCNALTAAVAHLPDDGPEIGAPVRKAASNCFAVHAQWP